MQGQYTSLTPHQNAIDYALLKTVHITAVVLTLGGFVLRGAGVLTGARWVQSRLARTLPHINDTVLLASAIVLAWMLGASPVEQHWLVAKIVALIVYVALGMIALKSASRRRSAVALVAALATFGYIVAVAISKSPWPF